MTVHIAKNFLDLPKLKVPLILGIWGGKGQGKTFQCTLAYKKLGIGPVVMSAGELESGNAGEPAKLIRQRYRSALIADCLAGSAVCILFPAQLCLLGCACTASCNKTQLKHRAARSCHRHMERFDLWVGSMKACAVSTCWSAAHLFASSVACLHPNLCRHVVSQLWCFCFVAGRHLTSSRRARCAVCSSMTWMRVLDVWVLALSTLSTIRW